MPEPAGASILSHGVRSSYVKGCRCNRCRAANADYYKSQREIRPARDVRDDTVDASRAREILAHLSELGIGRNSVHKACGVSKRLIWDIASGRAKRVLRSTESRILAIQPQAALPRGANVDAELTLQQISALRREGFTKGDIAERLNRFSDRLRIGESGRRVRVSSVEKVNKLYQKLMPADEERFTDAA